MPMSYNRCSVVTLTTMLQLLSQHYIYLLRRSSTEFKKKTQKHKSRKHRSCIRCKYSYKNKLAGQAVDSSELTFLPTSKSRDTKLGRISEIRPGQIWKLCPGVRIRGQLPAPIVNGGGDMFWKWPDCQIWKACYLDLELGSGHTAYRRVSLIDLYLRAKFHWNRRSFLWTDGRTQVRIYTDGRTDGHLRPALLGRLYRRIDMWSVNYTVPISFHYSEWVIIKVIAHMLHRSKKQTFNGLFFFKV